MLWACVLNKIYRYVIWRGVRIINYFTRKLVCEWYASNLIGILNRCEGERKMFRVRCKWTAAAQRLSVWHIDTSIRPYVRMSARCTIANEVDTSAVDHLHVFVCTVHTLELDGSNPHASTVHTINDSSKSYLNDDMLLSALRALYCLFSLCDVKWSTHIVWVGVHWADRHECRTLHRLHARNLQCWCHSRRFRLLLYRRVSIMMMTMVVVIWDALFDKNWFKCIYSDDGLKCIWNKGT